MSEEAMKGKWIFFHLEMKRLAGMLPLILLETILLGLLFWSAGSYAVKALYSDPSIGEIKVGIGAAEEDSLTAMLVRFVGAMDSLKGTASFALLSEEEAREQMERGEIDAAVIVPERMVERILSGENAPATVLLGNSRSRMETEVFAQLAQAGVRLLATAQAGIYGADAFWTENGMEERIAQTEEELNEIYLKYALGRALVFQTKEVNAIKGTGIADYYGISLMLAFLSLAGLSLGKCTEVFAGERERMLHVSGISQRSQRLLRGGAFALVFALLGMLISCPVYLLLIHFTYSSFRVSLSWILLAAVWLAMGLFLWMLVQILGNGAGGVLVCFVLLTGAMTTSGMFLPSAFLPLWAEKIGNVLPYREWMEAMVLILQGGNEVGMLGKLLAEMVLFLLTGVCVREIKAKGRQCRREHE